MIVKLEVRSVVKNHLALMRLYRLVDLAELDSERLGRVMRDFPELVKSFLVRETIRIQQQLVLAILNLVRRYNRFVELGVFGLRTHQCYRYPSKSYRGGLLPRRTIRQPAP